MTRGTEDGTEGFTSSTGGTYKSVARDSIAGRSGGGPVGAAKITRIVSLELS